MNTSRLNRRHGLLAALAGLALVAAGPAAAQSGQPIKLVVGYAAGGPVDASARLFAVEWSKVLGQTVVVENRVGAGGAIGGESVVKARPDGLTVFYGASPTMTISPHVLPSMPFKPATDLTPVAPVLGYTNMLVINKDQPFKTLPELIAYAKANPGKLSYGSAGNGASNHLSGELFAARAGIKMTHVPYKGNAPAMTDVIGGQINMMFDIISTAKTYVDSDKVLPVAVTSKKRNKALPNLPSMEEAGVPNYDVGGWYALFVPNKTDPALIKRYAEASDKVMNSPTMKAKLAELGYDEWHGTAKDVSDRVNRELKLWGEVVKGIQIK
ncbi:ABC transporter substrate-binding protein [Comamonas serinivorans]|uniref:ABC transporter substrate-binding protein n=1 Tax=Comamonas serinivorans TaxID=1082851 RepID=A0A1Y0EIX6_9BURK|nr:tripartite tricarboxylate transporter substrate binding protein [Comamonas serinivorans]ARU03319.1 ABC transporter substrate-binding protein [Comamonas serinivorans]